MKNEKKNIFIYKISLINFIKIKLRYKEINQIYFWKETYLIKIINFFRIIDKFVIFKKIKELDADGIYFHDKFFDNYNNQFLPINITHKFVKYKYHTIKNNFKHNEYIQKYFNNFTNKKWIDRYFFLYNSETIYRYTLFVLYAKFLKKNNRISNYIILVSNNYVFSFINNIDNVVQFNAKRNFFIFNLICLKLLVYSLIKFTISLLNKIVFLYKIKTNNEHKIAVQHCWGATNFYANDLYWNESNSINPSKILVYSDRKDIFFDKEAVKYLDNTKVNYLKLKFNFFDLITLIFRKNNNIKDTIKRVWVENPFIHLDLIVQFFKIYKTIYKFFYDIDKNELFSYYTLLEQTKYWKNFFIGQQIKINLNHSGDRGYHHVLQSLALDQIDGLNTRDSRSYSMKESLLNAREFHIYFAWGKQPFCSHQTVKNFNNYNVVTGYPFDYLFSQINNNFLQKEKKNIIIALFDTTVSTNYIKFFYQSFLNIINKNNNIKLAIKTKRYKNLINGLIKNSLSKELHNRIIFYDSAPCFIGKNADLSVCLGINTAGVEIALSGSQSVIYWIQKNYLTCNQFISQKNLVFNNIEEITEKIMLNNFKSNDYGNHKNIINDISGFSDHSSRDRINFIYSNLLHLYSKGQGSKNVVNNTLKLYEKKWGKQIL